MSFFFGSGEVSTGGVSLDSNVESLDADLNIDSQGAQVQEDGAAVFRTKAELDAYIATQCELQLKAAQQQMFDLMVDTRVFINEAITPHALFRALRASEELSTHIEGIVQQEVRPLFLNEVQRFGFELEGVKDLFRGEAQARCHSNAEVHARLTRELAHTSIHIEQFRSSLEETAQTERRERLCETSELRDILDTVWHQLKTRQETSAAGSNKQHFFRHDMDEAGNGKYSYKECVGDQEDVQTLYELVTESLGTSARLAKQYEVLDYRTELFDTRYNSIQEKFEALVTSLHEKFEVHVRAVNIEVSHLSLLWKRVGNFIPSDNGSNGNHLTP